MVRRSLSLEPGAPPARPRIPPPGSASASAAQVDALLTRLTQLEETVAVQQEAEDRLKEVNVALMERLSEFKRANEANVSQAEAELAHMHEALQAERSQRAEAEVAAAAATAIAADQRGIYASVDDALRSERLRAGEADDRLQQLARANAHTARVRAGVAMREATMREATREATREACAARRHAQRHGCSLHSARMRH